MLCFVNAIGASVPPVFIYPRKKPNADLIKGGPPGCVGLVHESGWMTGDNFYASMKHFHDFVKSSIENPVLLIFDNHSSHIDYHVLQFAKQNGIFLLTFPPHCSHALQPLDVAVFGPFKSGLKNSHNEWLQSHPGQRISIKEVASLCRIPYMQKINAENIVLDLKRQGSFRSTKKLFQNPDTLLQVSLTVHNIKNKRHQISFLIFKIRKYSASKTDWTGNGHVTFSGPLIGLRCMSKLFLTSRETMLCQIYPYASISKESPQFFFEFFSLMGNVVLIYFLCKKSCYVYARTNTLVLFVLVNVIGFYLFLFCFVLRKCCLS
ncbi:MFS-type transporter clz9-like [Daphnia magna]|uniref:MFS-type transporter clz9-like n=1 Tax=Daphnia magna TaxID=35525 RepID=UPI001E1BB81D|nr:MFS-type transporter clz9-like [Daphnia magna]